MDGGFFVGVMVESAGLPGPVSAKPIPPHRVVSPSVVDVYKEVFRVDDLDMVIL
jgi:hypothetical protein